jgi:L-ribulokinase
MSGNLHRNETTEHQNISMSAKYAIGLDYGTNSVRALVVDIAHGREVGTSVWNYEHGTAGVILGRDPNLARQHPADYVKGAEVTIRQALAAAKKAVKGFRAEQVAGIGVDTTGSTPLPVDDQGQPLAFDPRFAKNPAAMAWLWKDHRRGRGRRNHRAGEEAAPAISGQMRWHLLQ